MNQVFVCMYRGMLGVERGQYRRDIHWSHYLKALKLKYDYRIDNE